MWAVPKMCACVSRSVVSLYDSMDCSPPGFLCSWNSAGKNSGVGSHSLLQGTFLTQGSNTGLLHYRQLLYSLSHQHHLTSSDPKMENSKYRVLGGWLQVSGERELLVPPSTKGIFLPGLSWKRNTNLMGYVFLCFRSSSTWLGSLFLPAMQISFSRRAQLPVSVLCLYCLQLATCPGKNGFPWWLSGWDAGDIRSREKEMAVHSSILAWEIPWTEDLAGYSPGGHKESDTT